jgi:MinD superfamily P-loop ATPase
MTVLNVMFPIDLVNKIEDFSKIFREILDFNISLKILKFSTGINGLNLLIDIPDDKVSEVTKSLKRNKVVINKRGEINFISDKCIYCGSCVSLCPTDALFFEEDDKVNFIEEKCIGCSLCINSCSMYALRKL